MSPLKSGWKQVRSPIMRAIFGLARIENGLARIYKKKLRQKIQNLTLLPLHTLFTLLSSHAVFTPLLLILSFTLHSAHSSLSFDLFFNLASCSAIFAGPTPFHSLAVYAAPCGHCHQFLQELRSAVDIQILITSDDHHTFTRCTVGPFLGWLWLI